MLILNAYPTKIDEMGIIKNIIDAQFIKGQKVMK